MPGTDDAWKALLQVNDWIKLADAKAAAALAGSGVLGGLLVRGFPQPYAWAHQPWHAVLMLASFLLVSASTLLALTAVAPRLHRRGRPSIVYFGHIAHHYAELHDFKAAFLPALEREGQLRELLAEQLWTNSRIARGKLQKVSLSIWLLGGGLTTAALAGLLRS
ncbi:Pycsar system effector family protein [Saccharopolyspora sp. NPDC050389]|uniref:Pycsar system effector family protein n=1 Tax=Saccharopolyspora sp. NPDC050389 TaxID=3155516 RepID=UPI0033C353B2